MGLQWDMSVSDGSPMGHVGFRLVINEACQGQRWVTGQACWSPMKHVKVSKGSPIRHIGLQWVSHQPCWSPIGLQLGMLVSDEAC